MIQAMAATPSDAISMRRGGTQSSRTGAPDRMAAVPGDVAAEIERATRARPALVLLNPRAAGGRAAALAEPVREWLATYAPRVPLLESDSIERSRASLQCLPRSSRVVLIGGDGTLHHMLPVLLTHRLALGVVPMGGGNDTARALGVDKLAWPEALALALKGHTRRMDVGELLTVRGRFPFISSLAIGFDAAVGQRALEGPAWLDGMPRYLWATFGELAALRTHVLRARVDGELVHDGRALFTSVFNTPSYGSGMPAVPGARVADGKLDLLVAGEFGRLGVLGMLPRLLKGSHLGHAKVSTRTLHTLAIDSDDPLPMAADGEPLAPLRDFEVRVRASAISVVSARPARRQPAPEADADSDTDSEPQA
jgi:diacylglycerol kinase family enzyme